MAGNQRSRGITFGYYVGSPMGDVQVMLRGVGLRSGISRNLIVLKRRERDRLGCEQPSLH